MVHITMVYKWLRPTSTSTQEMLYWQNNRVQYYILIEVYTWIHYTQLGMNAQKHVSYIPLY